MFLLLFIPPQVLLWWPMLHPLFLPPLTMNPTVSPPPPPLFLSQNPPHPPPTPHPKRSTRQKAAWIPRRHQSPARLCSTLTPPPDQSQNLSPHLYEKLPRLPPGLPNYRTATPPTSVMETLTRWPCWGGRCLFSRWGNGRNITQERQF